MLYPAAPHRHPQDNPHTIRFVLTRPAAVANVAVRFEPLGASLQLNMIKQEILFVHQPRQISQATMQLVGYRLRRPQMILGLTMVLLIFIVGLSNGNPWLIGLPIGVFASTLLFMITYVIRSPRNFIGVEVQMSVRDDGIYFAGAHRSGMVGWAAFKEIYLLKEAWAAFFKRSDAVTYFPTEQLSRESIGYMLAKLRENGVKIYGDASAQ